MPGGRFEVPDSSDNDPFSEKSKKLLHDSHKEPKTASEDGDNEEVDPGLFDDDFVPEEDEEDIRDEDDEDEEYVPEKKVLAAKKNKPRKGKTVRRKPKAKNVKTGRKKVIATTSTSLSKEKENRVEQRQNARSTTVKEEGIDTRIYQKSLARRVPMLDPLKETNGVYEPIPANVKKVKLVISSRKRKLSSNILEPITQLKEVDSNSLESGSSKGAFRRSKKRKNKEVADALTIASTSRPRRKAAPKSFADNDVEETSNSADVSQFFDDDDQFQDDDFKQEIEEENDGEEVDNYDGEIEGEDVEPYDEEDFSLALDANEEEEELDLDLAGEGETEPLDGAINVMEHENDYEDFCANPSVRDAIEKKQIEIRMKRKEAKFLDDYVVIDSLRKKRKSGVRKQKRSKKMIKSEDGQSQEVVNNFDEEGLAEEQGPIDEPEDPDWNPESEVKRESREDDEFENEEDFKFDDEEEGEEEEIGMNTKKRGKKKRTRRDSISSQDKPKGAPTDRKIYGCLFCEFMGRKQAWLIHLKSSHSDKELLYCSNYRTCQMPFENEEQLKAHIEATHEKKNICNFEGCGKIFKQRVTLREHRRTHFPDGIDPDEPEMESGVRQADRSYMCTFCGKKYRTRNGFRAHEAMVHTRKLKHKCTHEGCTAAFFYFSELAIHTRKHTGELPFTCSFCGARYISHATLAQHERAAHLQTEDTECQICHKKLRKRNLPGHLKTHEGYDGIPCSVCGKEFPTIGGKNRHEKIHFEVKQHTCRFCGKSFVQRANMVAHERIHTGERPYKCKHCNEGFPQQTRRNQHEQTCKHRLISYNNTQT